VRSANNRNTSVRCFWWHWCSNFPTSFAACTLQTLHSFIMESLIDNYLLYNFIDHIHGNFMLDPSQDLDPILLPPSLSSNNRDSQSGRFSVDSETDSGNDLHLRLVETPNCQIVCHEPYFHVPLRAHSTPLPVFLLNSARSVSILTPATIPLLADSAPLLSKPVRLHAECQSTHLCLSTSLPMPYLISSYAFLACLDRLSFSMLPM
jgi:hypothetical protein